MALLPVAPDLTGGSLAEGPAPGFVAGALAPTALDEGATAADDFDASAPVADLSGSAGFGVVDADVVALCGTALLAVEPGLAGDALGLAEVSDAFPAGAPPMPLEPRPEVAGFVGPAPDDDGVALGGTALLPDEPGLTGDALGLAALSEALPDEPA